MALRFSPSRGTASVVLNSLTRGVQGETGQTGATGSPGPDGDEIQFNTVAAVQGFTFVTPPDYLRTAGYTTVGDGGGALYKKSVSEPSHEGKIQSADGTWWELAELEPNPIMFGADSTGVADAATAFTNAIGFLPTDGGTIKIPSGDYLIDTNVVIDKQASFRGEGEDQTFTGIGPSSIRTTSQTLDMFGVQSNNVHFSGIDFPGLGSRDSAGQGKCIVVGDDIVTVTDGAITASDQTFTSATGGLTGTSGQSIWIAGAGAGGINHRTTIASVTDDNTVELTAAAGTTVSGATARWGTNYQGFSVSHCSISSHSVAIDIQTGQNFNIHDNKLDSFDCIKVQNLLDGDGGEHIIESNLISADASSGKGVHWLSGGGLRVHDNKMLVAQWDIYIDWSQDTSGGPQILGNSFENGAGFIFITGDGTADLQNFLIDDNIFNGSSDGIEIDNTAGTGWLKNLVVSGNLIKTAAATTLVEIGRAADGFVISSNMINCGSVAAASGVLVQTAAANGKIEANLFVDCDGAGSVETSNLSNTTLVNQDGPRTDITVAATVELCATGSRDLNFSGGFSGNVTALGDGPEGTTKHVFVVTGAGATLVHGANIDIPGDANITMTSGDRFTAKREATGWLISEYTRNDGTPVSLSGVTIDAATVATSLDLDGNELILDADQDTSITADTDDEIDFRVAAADHGLMNASTFAYGSSLPATPDGTMHVHTASAGSVAPNGAKNDLIVENSASCGFSILAPDAMQVGFAFGSPANNLNWSFQATQASDFAIFRLGVQALNVSSDRQLTIGSANTAATGTLCLNLINGTAPTDGPTDGIVLYSRDVTASAEFFVMDEAANETQLSPHGSTLFEARQDDPFPWVYRSRNKVLGEEVEIDMSGLAMAFEEMTGKKFVHRKKIEKVDWDKTKKATVDANTEKRIIDLMGAPSVEISKSEAIESIDEKDEKVDPAEAIEEIDFVISRTRKKKGKMYRINPETGKVESFNGSLTKTEKKKKKRIKRGFYLNDITGVMYRRATGAIKLKDGVKYDKDREVYLRCMTRDEARSSIKEKKIREMPKWMQERLKQN